MSNNARQEVFKEKSIWEKHIKLNFSRSFSFFRVFLRSEIVFQEFPGVAATLRKFSVSPSLYGKHNNNEKKLF